MMSVDEIETHSVVGRISLAIGEMLERTGHPEVQRQPARRPDVDQKVLAMPARRGDAGAFKPARQLAGRDACQNPHIADRYAADGSTEAGRIQMPLIQFDI